MVRGKETIGSVKTRLYKDGKLPDQPHRWNIILGGASLSEDQTVTLTLTLTLIGGASLSEDQTVDAADLKLGSIVSLVRCFSLTTTTEQA